MQHRLFGVLVLIVIVSGCHKSIESPPSSALAQADRPRTLQELVGVLSEKVPATWEIEKGNRVCGRERDKQGNWKWSCIVIANPKYSDSGRQVAQEMGTLWSSIQFVAAHGRSYILIGRPEQPDVHRVAKVLGLTMLDPPKDIRTYVVEDCGLVWDGLRLKKPE